MEFRTYTELSKLETFKERFEYLRLDGVIGEDTFGFDRWINQRFYNSPEWRRLRNYIIVRDNGCDLGIEGATIYGKVLIHHMNPLDKIDILEASDLAMNPEYLISVSYDTHNAIHYGKYEIVSRELVERKPGDTKLW